MTGPEQRLGARWIAATIVGWLIGFAACEALQSFVSTYLVDGLVIGSAVGIAQWLVVRQPVSPRAGWVLASIVGFGVGNAAAELVVPGTSSAVGYALHGAIVGAFVGLAQSLVLRRRVASAGWWVPVNGGAWALGWVPIAIAEHATGWSTIAVYVGIAAGAMVGGAITGAALIWLLRIVPDRRPETS